MLRAQEACCEAMQWGLPPPRLVCGQAQPGCAGQRRRAGQLGCQRRQPFFKPVAGYGFKATCRGDKLAKRVWGEILAADLVAQALVPPAERRAKVTGC